MKGLTQAGSQGYFGLLQLLHQFDAGILPGLYHANQLGVQPLGLVAQGVQIACPAFAHANQYDTHHHFINPFCRFFDPIHRSFGKYVTIFS